MPQSERDAFLSAHPVSRETLAKLDRYAEMLVEWNARFNLVAESTLPHIWTRHFLDSAQLLNYLPVERGADFILTDMGSGAGFPGLVLSVMGVPGIHLIESTGKKANFLRAVIEELKLDAVVHQERVENLKGLKADVVTARAVAALPELLKLANHLTKKDSLCLFLKGKTLEAELTESAKCWTFDTEKHTSRSDDSGSVLIIRNLKWKAGNQGRYGKRKHHQR